MSSGTTDNGKNHQNTNQLDPAIYQTNINPSNASDADTDDDEDDKDNPNNPDASSSSSSSSPILFSAPPSFNTLNIVLRDKGVLRFTKYLTLSGAPGDRWDVLGEWEVDGLDDLEDDGEGDKER